MALPKDPYERYQDYKDTALDVIMNQIKAGHIPCGRHARKLKYGVPPDEVKGWWIPNDRHRDPKEEEKTTDQSGSVDTSQSGERKQNIVDLLREIDKRRNSGKY